MRSIHITAISRNCTEDVYGKYFKCPPHGRVSHWKGEIDESNVITANWQVRPMKRLQKIEDLPSTGWMRWVMRL